MGPKGHTNYMLTTISLGEHICKREWLNHQVCKSTNSGENIFESSPALDHLNRAATTRGKKNSTILASQNRWKQIPNFL